MPPVFSRICVGHFIFWFLFACSCCSCHPCRFCCVQAVTASRCRGAEVLRLRSLQHEARTVWLQWQFLRAKGVACSRTKATRTHPHQSRARWTSLSKTRSYSFEISGRKDKRNPLGPVSVRDYKETVCKSILTSLFSVRSVWVLCLSHSLTTLLLLLLLPALHTNCDCLALSRLQTS